MLTLAAMLERAERWFPEVELVEGDRRSNYKEMGGRARALARALLAAGLQPGERVALALWNRIAHLETWFGVALAGGVAHPLNLRLHPRQWAAILAQAQDRFAIVEAGLLDAWRQAEATARVIEYPGEYEALLAGAPKHDLPAAGENDGAAMGYTSGTTGEPKGVVYTHRALALHALTISLPDANDFRQRDCVLPLVPMFHANAWGWPHAATLLGARQVFAGGRFDAESVLDLLAGEQVTRSAGVPVIWQGVLDALERHPGRWPLHPELRVNLGGAPAPEALFRRFDRHGITVNMGWGMTEMTPVGAVNPLLAPDGAHGFAERRARQGRLLPLVEGRTAASGELEVRGPWVATRYVVGGEDCFTPDGWLRTGDIVEFDAGGLMRIVDRAKDLIRSGGEWISSVALENALASHPDVAEAAVIAVPHPKWQERPLALVVLRPGAAADAAAWRRHLEAHFPAWQCPDEFRVIEALPRTSTGKIDKRRLREVYRAANA
jgi:fatty-acyl-CoA synthase